MDIHAGERSNESVGRTKSVIVGERMSFTCGQSRFAMDSAGNIDITGVDITINGQAVISCTAPKIKMN